MVNLPTPPSHFDLEPTSLLDHLAEMHDWSDDGLPPGEFADMKQARLEHRRLHEQGAVHWEWYVDENGYG